MKQDKPWYEIFGGRYAGDEPFFFDPEEFPWTTILRQNWRTIRKEMEQLIESEPLCLKPYFSTTLVYPPRQWKTIGFYFWNWRLHRNCDRCPETIRILESIPHLVGVSLSILEPGANINPHQGDTNAQIKGHLALCIPAGLPDCGFQVGSEIRAWEEGEMLLFCDAQRHTAWNHTSLRRLLLIVDVIRPQFAHQTNRICAHVLASSMLQVIYQRIGWLNQLPRKVHHLLHFVLREIVYIVLPIQRTIGVHLTLARAKHSG